MRALMAIAALVGLAVGAAQAAPAAAPLPPFSAMDYYSTEAEFTAAIRPYTEAIARNANDAEAHHWLGIAYLHIARLHRLRLIPFGRDALGRAIRALERAMQLRPQLATLMHLIDAYMMAGELEKWRAALDRSKSLAPPLPLR